MRKYKAEMIAILIGAVTAVIAVVIFVEIMT